MTWIRKPGSQFFKRLKAYNETVTKKSRIRRFKKSDWWLRAELGTAVAGLIGLLFLIPTAYELWVDLEDRETQREVQALELVTRPAGANAG